MYLAITWPSDLEGVLLTHPVWFEYDIYGTPQIWEL